MKIRKIYEDDDWIDPYRIGRKIEQICNNWKEELNIQEFMIYEEQRKIYMKVYNEMNDCTFQDFSNLFNEFNDLNIHWTYKGGRELILNFSKSEQTELENNLDMKIDVKKYNL